MKKTLTYIASLILLVGFTQIEAQEDYSKMSSTELNEAFVAAVRKHDAEEVSLLIQAGANPNTPIHYTWTSGDCDWNIESPPHIYAAREGFGELFKYLPKDQKKLNEALSEAINRGSWGIVQNLIEAGTDVNYVDENKNTPLLHAIEMAWPLGEFYKQAQARGRSRWYQREQIIKTLIEAGADVCYTNENGETPLMKAIYKHDIKAVKAILETSEIYAGSYFGFGTKPLNYADKDGNTALMIAIQSIQWSYTNLDETGYYVCTNSQEIVNLLFEAPGIDMFLVNNDGETALTLFEKSKKKLEEEKKWAQ